MHIMREEGRRRLSVLPKPRLLALAVALASLAALVVLGLVAPMTLAANSNPDNHPPKAVLMKGDTAIQEGLRGSPCWSYWSKTGHHWNSYCADVGYAKKSDLYPRQAVPVPAGSTLRIRLYKPQRPDSIELSSRASKTIHERRGDGGVPFPTASGAWSETARRWRGISSSG
jgi:hypothetical protein